MQQFYNLTTQPFFFLKNWWKKNEFNKFICYATISILIRVEKKTLEKKRMWKIQEDLFITVELKIETDTTTDTSTVTKKNCSGDSKALDVKCHMFRSNELNNWACCNDKIVILQWKLFSNTFFHPFFTTFTIILYSETTKKAITIWSKLVIVNPRNCQFLPIQIYGL